jgi:hypothetical protein
MSSGPPVLTPVRILASSIHRAERPPMRGHSYEVLSPES